MISIVTAYYNRKKLFYETLKSINRSAFKDIEIIAVDDASSPEERIEDLMDEFPYLKVYRLEKKHKWYYNSCVPFNIGIKKACGDIIILQNPECLHVHDVLSYIAKEVNDFNYVTISAYQIGKTITSIIPQIIEKGLLLNFWGCLPQCSYGENTKGAWDDIGWYNHSKYRPVAFHFCSAITKKNMDNFRGFNMEFSFGIGFEDNEFIDRIRKSKLQVIINDEVSVIHQWHPATYDWNGVNKKKYRKNNYLYEEIKKRNVLNESVV